MADPTPTSTITAKMATLTPTKVVKTNVVEEKKKVLNKGVLAGIIIFYLIIIIISTYTGYIYGKENTVTALGISAGFCLSSILCIFLWVHGGRKTAGVCV